MIGQPVFIEPKDRLPEYDKRVLLSLTPRVLLSGAKPVLTFGMLTHTDRAGHHWEFEGGFTRTAFVVVAWRDVPEVYCKPQDLAPPEDLGYCRLPLE